MTFTPDLLISLLPPLFSHIGASLFFAKPRFGKAATAGIWLIYAAVFLILPPDMPTVNYFISLAAHLILFFVTTTGPVREKGFLFFSYACIITCSSAIVANVNAHLHSVFMKAAVACIVMALMQVILYGVLLPAFGKVIPYVRTGWGRFYAVVLSFYVLMVAQAVFPILNPMTGKTNYTKSSLKW